MTKILLVEDDISIIENLKELLKAEGFEVITAMRQSQALDLLAEQKFDLILLDISLPDGSGYAICSAAKASTLDNKNKDVPIIFITAYDDEASAVTGLDMGAEDYITKPFNIKEVILRINNLIKRSYDDPSKIKMDGYDIDLEKRRVFYNGEEIVLTTKEYDLLVYFINNKGLAISREQVLSKVWDENYFGSDRVVDDTLRRLRKKMPEINVRTIYGFGYRLD